MKPKDKVVEMISAYNDTTMMQDQLISKASECQDLEIQGLVTGSDILILEKKLTAGSSEPAREDLEEAALAAGFLANLWDSQRQHAQQIAFLASWKELH